jgi:hypothetical protein
MHDLTPLQRAILRIAWRNIQAEGLERKRARHIGTGADAYHYEVLRDHYQLPFHPRPGLSGEPRRHPLDWTCILTGEAQQRHRRAERWLGQGLMSLAARGLLTARHSVYGDGYELTEAGYRLAARVAAYEAAGVEQDAP